MGFGGRSRQLAGLWVTGSYMQRHISYSVSTLLNFGVSGEEEDVKQRERERWNRPLFIELPLID